MRHRAGEHVKSTHETALPIVSGERALGSRQRGFICSRDLIAFGFLLVLMATLASYGVERVLAMGGVSDCGTCHTVTLSNHPDIVCGTAGCHNPYNEGDFPRLFQDAVDSHPPEMLTCTSCHGAAFPAVPQHTEASLAASHATSTGGCEDCHATSLIDEHGKYPTGSATKYDCDVCHSSVDPDVMTAIANGDTSCVACHDVAEGHGPAHDGGLEDPSCGVCHSDNVSTQHGNDCATCHESMDPSVIAAISVGDVTCGVCHPGEPHQYVTSGYAPFFGGPYNVNYSGYLLWNQAQAWSSGNATSPHGNYATTTNKCAVCHAVHRAQAGGAVLTAWEGAGAETGNAVATASCIFCHGQNAAFTSVRINTESANSLSPHGRCQRCHAVSPHGVGASEYPVLKQKLLNTSADDAITADLAAVSGDANYNGLTASMFDLSDPALEGTGVSLGTGYLCSACHDNAANPVIFAVNTPGAQPTVAGLASTSPVTGHRVTATATDTWNEDGSLGAYYSGTTDQAGDSTVAFNDASSCKSCHDAFSTEIQKAAFPHNYVDSVGASVPKITLGSAFVWLTTAANADEARVVAGKTMTGANDGITATKDGLCLKCHVSGDGTAGVGITY